MSNASMRLLVAVCGVIGAFAVSPAWSQGREVNCDRVPDNPACAREPKPAHSGTATVPGKTPIRAAPPASSGAPARPWLKQEDQSQSAGRKPGG